jgi:hypothetical protein
MIADFGIFKVYLGRFELQLKQRVFQIAIVDFKRIGGVGEP